uniref:SH3 domain-containing protein n=1 Tax=Mola mola TaxID=94237 RepID=A0A3Q3WKN7_MOLML
MTKGLGASKLAKALYDNTAECADELAFRKGDIVTVMDQNVPGNSGWWMCSLYGRHGLAPANRLQLLPLNGITATSSRHVTEKNNLIDIKTDESSQNIYQIPSVPRPSSSRTYERMDMIYKIPSSPLSASKSPVPSAMKHSTGPEVNMVLNTLSFQGCLHLSLLISTLCSCAQVYAVPPSLPQDPNYDIPVPSATEAQQKVIGGYNTLSNSCKSEWIYDVPVAPEKQSPPQGSCETIPSKCICRQLYETVPAHALTNHRSNPTPSLYDIPQPSSLDIPSPPKVLTNIPTYNKPPSQRLTQDIVYAVPPQEESLTQVPSDPPSDHIPLECRGDSSNAHELKRVRLQRMRNFLACTSFHDLQRSGGSLVKEDNEQHKICATCSQRISTGSSSSTSSCDSLALSSSSPELLREVTLSQDEASHKLLDLQESVGRAVPHLMEFVSSQWRSKEHMEKHLNEIKEAAEEIACSLTSFLNFALDIKGNACRLTDANLQTRLYKQFSIVKDSGLILQQTVGALNMAGWPLNRLCQDPEKVQTPDQLDRFVMVARTVPEDVKRLVSIINANGKLLFRAPQKDPEPVITLGHLETKKIRTRQETLCVRHDTYQLSPCLFQSCTAQADNKCHSSESGSGTEKHRLLSLSEHCRLYFGALQKAIGGFVGSLQDGQPPEKFILQSKLVIMVGQRLVDTLCREAQRGGSSQSLLCKSNHLCALLKQLAVATKKAALHFPDRQALQEALEFAKELAQRAQHFRILLDI